jgi:hypothetical protein
MSPAPTSQSFTPPAMACQPARSRFLARPQLLTRLSAFPRARRSGRLPAPLDRSCVPREDERLSAGTLVSQFFLNG